VFFACVFHQQKASCIDRTQAIQVWRWSRMMVPSTSLNWMEHQPWLKLATEWNPELRGKISGEFAGIPGPEKTYVSRFVQTWGKWWPLMGSWDVFYDCIWLYLDKPRLILDG
jgi:hypothetical protein